MNLRLTAAALAGLAAWPAAVLAAQPAKPAGPAAATADSIPARIEAALSALEKSGDFAAARAALEPLFDRLIAAGSPSDAAAFREAAFALRLVRFTEPCPDAHELFRFLRSRPKLAAALVFLIDPEHESPAEVMAVLQKLRQSAGDDQLEDYANLAAAICVVHDRPPVYQVQGADPPQAIRAAAPAELFSYYSSNARSMVFGPTSTPPELLIYVVDATAPLGEMRWAQDRFGPKRTIGPRYHEIKYDNDHFKRNKPKKVFEYGFTLQNIFKAGGVCAEQAYYATHVGKATGVPSATVTGQGGSVSHAWIGFLETRGRTVRWNFDEGRWDEYEDVRGTVVSPQTGRAMSDGELGLTARTAMVDREDREAAVALTDAALRLAMIREKDLPYPPAGLEGARPADVDGVLELTRAALESCPAHTPAWAIVGEHARSRKLSAAQTRDWAEALLRFCGRDYPDFTFDVLMPMIEGVADARERDRLYEWAFDRFKSRPDLAAGVRLAQGRMWQANDERSRAWACFWDVINRFPDDGPFVVEAVAAAEKLLVENRRADQTVGFLKDAWRRTRRPSSMSAQFLEQSNWYRVGAMYAGYLERAGQASEARNVRKQLGIDY